MTKRFLVGITLIALGLLAISGCGGSLPSLSGNQKVSFLPGTPHPSSTSLNRKVMAYLGDLRATQVERMVQNPGVLKGFILSLGQVSSAQYDSVLGQVDIQGFRGPGCPPVVLVTLDRGNWQTFWTYWPKEIVVQTTASVFSNRNNEGMTPPQQFTPPLAPSTPPSSLKLGIVAKTPAILALNYFMGASRVSLAMWDGTRWRAMAHQRFDTDQIDLASADRFLVGVNLPMPYVVTKGKSGWTFQPLPPPTNSPYLVITPTQGPPGTPVTIAGWVPPNRMNSFILNWMGPHGELIQWSVATQTSGTFRCTGKVPATYLTRGGSLPIEAGQYTLATALPSPGPSRLILESYFIITKYRGAGAFEPGYNAHFYLGGLSRLNPLGLPGSQAARRLGRCVDLSKTPLYNKSMAWSTQAKEGILWKRRRGV